MLCVFTLAQPFISAYKQAREREKEAEKEGEMEGQITRETGGVRGFHGNPPPPPSPQFPYKEVNDIIWLAMPRQRERVERADGSSSSSEREKQRGRDEE